MIQFDEHAYFFKRVGSTTNKPSIICKKKGHSKYNSSMCNEQRLADRMNKQNPSVSGGTRVAGLEAHVDGSASKVA